MVRPLRIEFDDAWYHVMNRGLERRLIFRDDQDRWAFFDLLGEASRMFSIEVHAFSLMDNHYHLLIHTPRAGLARALRHVNGVYTQRFNRRHRRDGPLFRGRYKAVIVDADEYLLQLVRYIHLNPVEAGLCRNPFDHHGTSHRYYLAPEKKTAWLHTDEVLNRFGKVRKEACQKLDEFVLAGISSRERRELSKPTLAMVGSKGFKEWVYGNFLPDTATKSHEIGTDKSKTRNKVAGFRQILDLTRDAYDLSLTALRSGGRGRKNEARQVAGYLMRNFLGLPLKEISHILSAPSNYAVALSNYRLRQRMGKEKKLRQMVKTLEKSAVNRIPLWEG